MRAVDRTPEFYRFESNNVQVDTAHVLSTEEYEEITQHKLHVVADHTTPKAHPARLNGLLPYNDVTRVLPPLSICNGTIRQWG